MLGEGQLDSVSGVDGEKVLRMDGRIYICAKYMFNLGENCFWWRVERKAVEIIRLPMPNLEHDGSAPGQDEGVGKDSKLVKHPLSRGVELVQKEL